MGILGKIVLGILGGLLGLLGIGWLGLQISPANLPTPPDAQRELDKIKVPENLPAPLQRYFDVTAGEAVPQVESLIVFGRARANFGLWMPLRYQLTHRSGYAFERYMEVTWFGMPVLKALDRYVDGVGMTGPLSNLATGPETDQGANMILWVEAPLMPSLWLTDPRIRWEEIDETSVRLIFPFGDVEDELTVHLDPNSGLITHMSALRYRDGKSGKIPWRADFHEWQRVSDVMVPARVSITWEDQGEPWSYWDLEEYFWNVDISEILGNDGAEVAIERFEDVVSQK